MQSARCASDSACMPLRRNRSGFSQTALPLLLSAEAGGYHWTFCARLRRFPLKYWQLSCPLFWNKSVPIPDNIPQIPSFLQSSGQSCQSSPDRLQKVPGSSPGFRSFPWSLTTSDCPSHTLNLLSRSKIPASRALPVFPRSSAAPAENA